MTEWDWQLPAAILCVLFAAWVLVRRGLGLIRGKTSCGDSSGCGSCSTPTESRQSGKEKAFVSLESLSETRKDQQH